MHRDRDTERYIAAVRIVELMRSLLRRIEIMLLALAMLFTAGAIWDMHAFTAAGLGSGHFPGFDELHKRNPDICAWIIMDGTHINHPVVQGEDNFEYLSKDPDGEFYQGGSIFLDADNARDFSDSYIIIHGHHMARGAMFSDVTDYLDGTFFTEHTSGELITPGGAYELRVAGAKVVDAYEGEFYYTGDDAGRPLHLMSDCTQRRDVEFSEEDKLVVLSTCAGDMSTKRAVVFCRARLIGSPDVHPDGAGEEAGKQKG